MKEVLDYNVLPENYSIKIKIEEDHFTGEEEVKVNITKNTQQFNFNVWKMEFSEINFEINGKIYTPRLEVQEEVATLFFEEELKANTQGLLRILYKGVYSEDMWGFCKSKYNEDLLFSTDFEPTCARRAFPCWDQPDMKATFDISVCPLPGHGALSNSSLKEIKDGYFVFNTTPKMSTYIVAFISGKLKAVEAKTKRNVPIGVYAHKDEKEWGRYALNVAVECLDFFEDYFGILYPLPKLDLVCIPAFVSGAMENWGLVTFRKTSLLLNESSSYRSKKLIAETVCHELAHMWFGNLVTMAWWNDLWLNEGFATWAASLALANLSKSLVNWEVWIEFINSDIEAGLLQDCLESSHPIAVEVNKPSEISQIFDTISYSKGASMIRMLEGYIGQDEFKKGIRHYLNKFQYSNATTKDLWNSFDPKLEVESFMNDWINKQGYPIVYVSEGEESTYITLRQSQFLLSGRKSDSIWKVPITFSWGETILMTQREIKVIKKSLVYKINMGGYAFFRTSYDTQNLAHLLESTTDVENKLNLVNDIFALCNAKMMKAIDVIVLCELFRNETNPEILTSIFSTLNKFKSLWYENENVLRHLNEVISDLIGSRVNEIDIFTKESSEDWITTNSILINNALRSGNSKIIKNLKEAYNNQGHHSINPEFIRSVFISVIDDKYEEIFSLTKTSAIPEEKIVALSSLANINNEKSLTKILTKFKEFEPHNSIYFFLNLILNEKNRDLILNFICENFDEIRSFMKNDRLFSYVVERVLSCASTEKISLKIIELLNLKKNGEIEMSVNKAIEKIKWNLEFKEFNKEVIKN